MRTYLSFGLVSMAMFAAPIEAQIEPNNAILFATYECDQVEVAQADELVADVIAPVLNRYAAEGKILVWGYIAAWIGQDYNRAFYVWASDVAALVDARMEYLTEIQAMPEFAEFAAICEAQSQTIHSLVTGGPVP